MCSPFSLLYTKMTVLAVMSMLMASCTVGPDYKKPDAPKVSGYTPTAVSIAKNSAKLPGGGTQLLINGEDISGAWWELFQSKQLNNLIEQSIKANPNLDAAKAALRMAQENVKAQQGFYYPSVTGGYTASRQKIAQSVAANDPLPSGELLFNLYTPQVGVSYAPDVFGLNRRTVESLQAQAESQRYQLAAAYITLTSNVVVAAIEEASLREQAAATHQLIDINADMLRLLRNQLAKGSASQLDVAAQQAQLEQVQALLPPLEKQLAQQRDLLTALAGRYSNEEVAEKFELSDLQLPRDLPLSLPSQLVEQRPDVLSAEAQLHSASAQIGVAVANRLPQFNIDAVGGYTGTIFSHLINPTDSFWSVTGGVTQPIFDGGTLLHRQKAAKEAYIQAEAQYKSTVITAFQNVADTLHALDQDAKALNIAISAKNTASHTLDLTKRQLQSGSINYLSVLTAEQVYQQAMVNLIQAQANRYSDTAALFLALGGGWWNAANMATANQGG